MRRLAYIAAGVAAVGIIALVAWQMDGFGQSGPLVAAHAGLQSDCGACHEDNGDVDIAKCAACHTDPATGKAFAFRGFAKHHRRTDLPCLACHTDHQGADVPTTRQGVTFATVGCKTCHPPGKLTQPLSLAKVPVSVRGKMTHFPHAKHPARNLSCSRCHPMKPRSAHVPAGPYAENCSSCHHGPGQRASCDTCHKKAADYYAGRFEGRNVGFGSHGKSGEVTCVGCHRFNDKTSTFKPPSSTCTDCHPPLYWSDFLVEQAGWRRWQKTINALPPDSPDAKRLRFVARFWYHNDKQSAKVRQAQPTGGQDPARRP